MRGIIVVCCCIAALAVTAAPAKRVVSLAPVMTEIVFALDAGDLLVGRSSACDYPEEAKELPVAGNFANPVFERILKLKPDLILTDTLQDPGIRETYDRLGIPIEVLPLNLLADYPAAVRRLGELLDREEQAEQLVEEFSARLAGFTETAGADAGRPRTLILVWDAPLITPGGKSFLDQYIELAGGVNIAHGEERDYFHVSVEWLIGQAPEVILLLSGETGEPQPWTPPSGWEGTPAARDGRCYRFIDDGCLSRLGPRWYEGVELLRKLIHPEAADAD